MGDLDARMGDAEEENEGAIDSDSWKERVGASTDEVADTHCETLGGDCESVGRKGEIVGMNVIKGDGDEKNERDGDGDKEGDLEAEKL